MYTYLITQILLTVFGTNKLTKRKDGIKVFRFQGFIATTFGSPPHFIFFYIFDGNFSTVFLVLSTELQPGADIFMAFFKLK